MGRQPNPCCGGWGNCNCETIKWREEYQNRHKTEREKKVKESQFIFFWGANNENGWLSNFYEAPVEINGIVYPTNEHFFMAHKAIAFQDVETLFDIWGTKNPGAVKKLGRQVKGFDPNIWAVISGTIMMHGLIAKFSAHPELAAKLLATGNKTLVEASPYDKIWGIGMGKDEPGIEDPLNWQGTNQLGEILMTVRKLFLCSHIFNTNQGKFDETFLYKNQNLG